MANEKRLIDANAIEYPAYFYDNEAHPDPFIEGYRQGKIDAICDIRALAPTVDAVPVVHGRWECEHETWGQLQCSNCKKQALLEKSNGDVGTILLYVTSNYCPNCGAKMDGDGNGS